jgi:hypothetical protein
MKAWGQSLRRPECRRLFLGNVCFQQQFYQANINYWCVRSLYLRPAGSFSHLFSTYFRLQNTLELTRRLKQLHVAKKLRKITQKVRFFMIEQNTNC